MGSSQSLSHFHGQKIEQQQNGLYEQKQLAALKTISSVQQFPVIQLPTETIVDILLFVPNEELVLTFVFVSRKFSTICIPILRTRFADNISTWVKQFTNPCDDYPRNLNSNSEIVSLMWANVCNWNLKYPDFSGFIKVKIPKHILRRNPVPKFDRSQNRFKCARARRFSAPTFLDDSTEPNVSVHYTCCMNSNNGSDKYEYKEEKAMLLNKYRDGLNIYSFHIDVPKNTNRFMQLKFYIQCNYDGKVYYDKNGNELYVFASQKGMLGRTIGTSFYLLVLLLLLLMAFYYFWFWPSIIY